jgi:uncharacterized protein YbgA (DUF1722 family)/uncharacterized protein YbbK (DUF523 family)
MSDFPKPKVVISKCLGFENCRYNGEIIEDRFAAKLAKHVEFVPVCPEVAIGMGTPRPPVRLVASAGGIRMIQPTSGADLTEAMQKFSGEFLDKLRGVDGFILTHRSPSCGTGDAKYYAGAEKGPALGKTSGLFAEAVAKRFPHLAIEGDGRLLNLRIREHFLTRIFAFARLRELRHSPHIKDLVRFHSGYKFLIMANSEKKLRDLGRIVANSRQDSPAKVLDDYTKAFHEAFQNLPRTTAQINGLMHMFGYFSDKLTAREKKHFLAVLGDYRHGRLPLQAVTSVLWSWALRFDSDYIQGQSFFQPFPENLLDIEDSGKGRTIGA